MTPRQIHAPARRRSHAFTLVELLVVIAVIGILAGLILPALAGARSRGQSITCLNNVKQLQTCWLMYVNDHNNYVPPNRSGKTNGIWRSTPDSWIGNSNARRDASSANIESGLLFKYGYDRALRTYHCPADTAEVGTPGGGSVLRTRSYSMSGCWGGRKSEVQTTVPRLEPTLKVSSLFVFIEEHEDSIDDAHFLTWPEPDDRWANLPSGRHAQSGILSFADGHVERWKWLWPKKFRPRESYWKKAENEQDLADLRRLQHACIDVKGYRHQN
jgi:prepilin-type N-terminal cleavage/methylation domain-containing protein/prepilin-type processing-associated H-X9-DG protein